MKTGRAVVGAPFSFSSTCSAPVAPPGRPLLLLDQLRPLILRLEQPAQTDVNAPKREQENRPAIVRPAIRFDVNTAMTSTATFDFPAESAGKFAWMSTAPDEQ